MDEKTTETTEQPTDELGQRRLISVLERIAIGCERAAKAQEMQALAAWGEAQHLQCNHKDCEAGAVRLVLDSKGIAVVPACAEHDAPVLPTPPRRAQGLGP